MNIEQWENKIIQYHEGELTEIESKLLIDSITSDIQLGKLFKEYEIIYQELSGVEKIEVPQEMASEFSSWLASQTKGTKPTSQAKVISFSSIKKWSTLAACLVLGLLFWNIKTDNQTSSIDDLERALAADLRSSSTTDRIRAIRVANTAATTEADEIIHVLSDVLANDQNSHVRLAAVGTLSSYIDRADVRTMFIKHLTKEESGIVKLEILSALENQDSDQTIQTFENIVNDDSQEKFVKDKAHMHLIRYDQRDI